MIIEKIGGVDTVIIGGARGESGQSHEVSQAGSGGQGDGLSVRQARAVFKRGMGQLIGCPDDGRFIR